MECAHRASGTLILIELGVFSLGVALTAFLLAVRVSAIYDLSMSTQSARRTVAHMHTIQTTIAISIEFSGCPLLYLFLLARVTESFVCFCASHNPVSNQKAVCNYRNGYNGQTAAFLLSEVRRRYLYCSTL